MTKRPLRRAIEDHRSALVHGLQSLDMRSETRTDAVGSELTVLIVEDEIVARNTLATLLDRIGYVTTAVGSAESALQRLDDGAPLEVVLVDLDLPGMSGAELIAQLAKKKPSIFPILITAAPADRVAAVINSGVPHLRKPLDFSELLKVLDARIRCH
jgi:CheY-like chemotaxis protein